MDISVVISLYNERESLQELVKGIGDAIAPTGLTYNIIMVNDGSTDGSWELIKEMAKTNSHIKGICFRKNYGKSAALFHGFEEADGEVVITMDADLQDDPREIPALYDMIMKEGYDLVSGWKKKRYDSKLTKNLPSKLYNATARKVEKDIISSLKTLGMPNVRFKVEITPTEAPTPRGMDKVSFLFSANLGSSMQNISQVASGGETARVMLSLKAMLSGAVSLPTIIFDEIDTGVSGHIAEAMAHIMQEMGRQGRQVISITHLPQIAALGKHHFKVWKEDTQTHTLSHITCLSQEERVSEIANMLSGSNVSPEAVNNARALLGL